MAVARTSVSLTRAHKIVERLRTLISEASAQSLQLVAVRTVDGFVGDGSTQVTELSNAGASALTLLARVDHLHEAWVVMRGAIAAENAKRGLNEMLARQDALARRISHVSSVLALAEGRGACSSIEAAELPQYTGLSVVDVNNSRALRASVTVRVLTPAQRDGLRAQVAALRKESFGLADAIAEANAARFEIFLEESVLAEVTGG